MVLLLLYENKRELFQKADCILDSFYIEIIEVFYLYWLVHTSWLGASFHPWPVCIVFPILIIFFKLSLEDISFMVISEQERLTLISMLQFH